MKIETVFIGNIEYYVVQKILVGARTYYMLVSTIDETDMIIRRLVIENNKEYLVGLEDEKEFDLVMQEHYKLIEANRIEDRDGTRV